MGPRAFITYAHEDDDHVEAVRRFWELLRANGIDARLDLSAAATRQDWPVWMMAEFQRADYILVIASPAYRRRAEGAADPDDGRGVQFEGALLRELLYADRREWFHRILPVVLPGQSRAGIPIFLGPVSASVYEVAELTAAGVEPIRRVITGRPAPPGPDRDTPPPATTPVPVPSPVRVPAAPDAGDRPRRSTVAEVDELATALGRISELADAAGRRRALSLLPPDIHEQVEDAPTTRLHLFAIVRACGRFGETGRAALLDLLRHAFPSRDPAVARAIALVETSWFFADQSAG